MRVRGLVPYDMYSLKAMLFASTSSLISLQSALQEGYGFCDFIFKRRANSCSA